MKIILALVILVLFGCSNADCESYSIDRCPEECVICPPCEVCSSISCQSEDFCENIGFNRSWEKDVGARTQE